MQRLLPIIFLNICVWTGCAGYKVLAIFPYNGRSHHIIFTSLVEELAARNHDVTVINYFPVKNTTNLRQISLQDETGAHCDINMENNLRSIPSSPLVNFYRAYDMATSFRIMANNNCKKMMENDEIRAIIASGDKYDLVIAEQFVTDCSLAIAYKLNAPTVGMSAHILMPWTYSRIGASNHPAFVPNGFFSSGGKTTLWKKIQSAIITIAMNAFFKYGIQRSDQQIVNNVYPEVPDLEGLGRNISLVMINQYFPLTGSRLYGSNVIEVGGLHVKPDKHIVDKVLKQFLDNANNDVIYISFGTVASHFPPHIIKEIKYLVQNNTNFKFVWKIDNVEESASNNLFIRKWLPQPDILCHPNVVAFVTHSGMLSTTEAIHCGVPTVGVPLFGDQFSNADSAEHAGLGVVLDIYTLNRNVLEEALQTVLQDKYQKRAKELSTIWKDRPMSAMDTAVFWIEYVSRHRCHVDLKPAVVKLDMFQYLLIDMIVVLVVVLIIIIFVMIQCVRFVRKMIPVCEKRRTKVKRH